VPCRYRLRVHALAACRDVPTIRPRGSNRSWAVKNPLKLCNCLASVMPKQISLAQEISRVSRIEAADASCELADGPRQAI
jgi:hypothetical protein